LERDEVLIQYYHFKNIVASMLLEKTLKPGTDLECGLRTVPNKGLKLSNQPCVCIRVQG
jgi:hypothetical protein